jgi:hypothetical protein
MTFHFNRLIVDFHNLFPCYDVKNLLLYSGTLGSSLSRFKLLLSPP